MSQNKSYRIRTNINEDKVVNVNLNRDFDFLEMLSVKISQESVYNVKSSNYGVVIGRVIANDGFGVPNAKVSIFIQKSEDDRDDVSFIYPYNSVLSKDKNNIRYNLLPNTNIDDCHQGVGTFPSKRELLDNDSQIEVYERYWKYTTVTNNSGDYMLFGVPTGSYILHVDIDLSDIGVLSQKPSDFFFKGYNRELFESAKQFKTSTNLDSLTQIVSENKTVQVFPFWGDPDSGDNISITRCDVNINYKFEPTCIFLGSIITDSDDNSISNTCVANRNSGDNGNMVTKNGTIEMIRKTPTGTVEEFRILGNELINGDGVWCYQIPMNLDYITTDEFGDIVPSNDVTKGIPTRTSVRFRVSLDNGDVNDNSNYRFKYLIPNYNDDGKYTYDRIENYRFGSGTLDEHFRDLYWDDVYTVKSYIPRVQKIGDDKNVVGNNCNKNSISLKYTNFSGQNNPLPYNKINICKKWWVGIFCALLHFVLIIINVWNDIIDALSGLVSFFGGDAEKAKISVTITDDDSGKIINYKPTTTNKQAEIIKNQIDKYILDEYKIIDLGFYNDWLNGSLYLPVMNFTKNKNGEWDFCNCENKNNTDLKIFDNCKINTSLSGDTKYINNQYQTSAEDLFGIGKVVKNMDDLNVYYYSTKYKTDIVLLGNIKNNMSLLNKLTSTTYTMPPIFNTYKVEIDDYGDAKSSVIEITEPTAMDWDDNDKDYQGLFFNFKCLDLSTKLKSCVNVKRICELGVGQDVKQDGLILKDEIFDNDGRLMFTMLNGNGLLAKRKDKKTNYYINQFKNAYHYGFDGITDIETNPDYINFIKNNSFYFYFGLHYGKTAIDEFKRLYDQTCKPLGELKMDYTIDYSDSSACNNTGVIKIINVAKKPYDVIINGDENQGLYGMNGDTMITDLDNSEYIIDIIDSDDNKSTEVIELNKNKFGFTINNTFFNEEVEKIKVDGKSEYDTEGKRLPWNFVQIGIYNVNYCGSYISNIAMENGSYDYNDEKLQIICNGVVNNHLTSFNVKFKITVTKKSDEYGNFFDLTENGFNYINVYNNTILFSVSMPGMYYISIGEFCGKTLDEDADGDTISTTTIKIPNKLNVRFMINDVNSEYLFKINDENKDIKTIDSRFAQFISQYNNELNIKNWYKNIYLINNKDNANQEIQVNNKYENFQLLDGKLKIENTASNISLIDDFVNDICCLMIDNSVNTFNKLNGNQIKYSANINDKNIDGNDIYLVYDMKNTSLEANNQNIKYDKTDSNIINSVNINNGIIITPEPLVKLNLNGGNNITYENKNSFIYSGLISNENGTKIPNNIVEYDGTNNSLNNYIKLQTVDRGIYGDLTFMHHNKHFKNGNKSNIIYGNVYGGLPLNFDDKDILSKFSDIKKIQKDDDTFIIENYHENDISIDNDNDDSIFDTIFSDDIKYAKVMSMLIRLFRFNNIKSIIDNFQDDSILTKMKNLANNNIKKIDDITDYLKAKEECGYLDLRIYNFFDENYIGEGNNAKTFLFNVLNKLFSNENFKSFINFDHEYTYYFTSTIGSEDNNIIVENFTYKFPNNVKPNISNRNYERKLPCDINNTINDTTDKIKSVDYAMINMDYGYGVINVDNICYEKNMGVFKISNKKVSVNKPSQDIPFYHLSDDTNINDIIFNTNDKNVEKKIRSYHVNYGKTIGKNELYLTDINMSFYRQNFNDSNFNNIVYYSNGELNDKTTSFFEENDGESTSKTCNFSKFKYEDDVLCFYITYDNNIGGWYCFNEKYDKTCTLSLYTKLVQKQALLYSSIKVSLKFYEDLVKEISTMLINNGEYFGNGDISLSSEYMKTVGEDNTLYFTTKEEINLDGNCFDIYTTFYNKTKKTLNYTLNTYESSGNKYVQSVAISDDLFDNVINNANKNNIKAWFSNNPNNRQLQCVISYSVLGGIWKFELNENDNTKLSINDNVYLYITVGDDNMESYHLTINEPLSPIVLKPNNNGGNNITIVEPFKPSL